jgi:hypothetical protein
VSLRARAAGAPIGALAIAFAAQSLGAQAGGGGAATGQGGTGADSALVTAVVREPARASLGDMLYFPLLFGIRIPSYDRSDGLSLPWGPQFALPDDRLVVDGLVTYRSHLGHFDPSLSATGLLSHSITARLVAGRATLTNDAWTVSDLVNSASVGASGDDGRNYFRSDRIAGTVGLHTGAPDAATGADLYAGARFEYDHSVGPERGARHQVWTLFNHSDTTGILRPNPPVARGHIGSVIAGGKLVWEGLAGAHAHAALDVEAPWTAPGGGHFVQLTFDGHGEVPTIFDHRITVHVHVLGTAGDTAPPQRYAYVGGSNTLPTREMLDEGGDELAYTSMMYVVPLHHPVIPILGAPSIALRYVVGGAGVQHLPTLTQNIGPRLMLFIFRAEYLIDPVTSKHAFSFGITLSRAALEGL